MKYLLSVVSIVAAFLILAGCTSQTNTPTIENKLSTLDPSEMALQLSDLPEGYVKLSSEYVNVEEKPGYYNVKEKYYNATKGYRIAFQKETPSNISIIIQTIFIVPTDPPPYYLIMDIINHSANINNTTILKRPNIGDFGLAIWITDGKQGDEFIIYFVKKNVWEIIEVTGSPPNYKDFNSIAQKASEKIK